ncbi:MAG: methanogenesis marker 15 protein, partial [Methanosarcinales archaeon]
MNEIEVAQISCGSEYTGIQGEIESAAEQVGAKIIFPDIDLEEVEAAEEKFGLRVTSPDLKLMLARAISVVEGHTTADAVFIGTCFRCAEG